MANFNSMFKVFVCLLLFIYLFVCYCLQESSTWVEKDLSFTSPADMHSPNSSSGEDDEGAFNRRRNHFPSESSDDDDDNSFGKRNGKPLIIEENKSSNGSNDLGQLLIS